METSLFPVFLKLAGRRVLVVGAGPVATSKIEGAACRGRGRHRRRARDDGPRFEAAPVTRVRRPFEPADLDGAWLVVTAATPAVNREVARVAEERRVFVNAVDDPPTPRPISVASSGGTA